MATDETNASKLIDERIRELGDWRGETLARIARQCATAFISLRD